METNPLAPRQRNRRTERPSAEAPAVPAPQQQAQPASMPQMQPSQPAYAQSPRMMYQQQTAPTPASPPQQMPASQPVWQASAAYPQAQPRYSQAAPQPPVQGQPARPMQPPAQPPVQYAPRPRVLNHSAPVHSGWQQSTPHRSAEAPHARAARSLNRDIAREEKALQKQAAREQKEARRAVEAPEVKPEKKKLPGWLTTALSLSLIGVMGLVAIYYLMQAYLVTEENKRIAAYQATLNRYHITESADGALQVTWQDEIEQYAAQYNLQPAFVTAIIRNESSFRTNAESDVGARGLMQLMPDTATWIAGKLDDTGYTFDRMWDAETNIRYGCWYLGYLSRLFRGDPVLVSAAYHAGQTTVTQWLSDPDKSDDGVTLDLDALTDGPTKQYIGRVTQTYGIYQTLLYPDEAFGFPDAVPAGSDPAASAQR